MPPDPRNHAPLRTLLDLARLERGRAMAGLGHALRSRGALREALNALEGAGTLPEGAGLAAPALMQAALRHQHWAEGQRRMLNLRLARIEADCARERPVAARAHGRVRVLEELVRQSARNMRRGEGCEG